MAQVTVTDNEKSIVFWQEWDDKEEMPGEPALLITKYSSEISIQQGADTILISLHEVKNFIKELQKLIK